LVEPEELADMAGMVVWVAVVAVLAWVMAWAMAWAMAWVSVWVLAPEELDCHNRRCFGKQ
jgi:hypothetical protein